MLVGSGTASQSLPPPPPWWGGGQIGGQIGGTGMQGLGVQTGGLGSQFGLGKQMSIFGGLQSGRTLILSSLQVSVACCVFVLQSNLMRGFSLSKSHDLARSFLANAAPERRAMVARARRIRLFMVISCCRSVDMDSPHNLRTSGGAKLPVRPKSPRKSGVAIWLPRFVVRRRVTLVVCEEEQLHRALEPSSMPAQEQHWTCTTPYMFAKCHCSLGWRVRS